jgi:hypothetical protein
VRLKQQAPFLIFGGDLESPNAKKVLGYLADKRIGFVAAVRQKPNSETVLLVVHEDAVSEIATTGKTSRRQLTYLKNSIARELGLDVEIQISKGKAQEDLEAGLTALLKHRFPNAVQDCFISSLESGFADIWLAGVSKEAIATDKSRRALKEAISEYLKLFSAKLRQLHFGDEEPNVPTSVAILKSIKVFAPVHLHELEANLRTANAILPSASWLRGKLDLLRKQGLILWRQDGQYVVTSSGLAVIPHTKTRTSSDVQRALVLGRRKW